MNTSALIMMLVTEITIACVTGYFSIGYSLLKNMKSLIHSLKMMIRNNAWFLLPSLEKYFLWHVDNKPDFSSGLYWCFFIIYLALQNSKADFDVEIIPADQADFLTFKPDSAQREISYSENKPQKQIDYFYFDPNTLETAGWIDLGFLKNKPHPSFLIVKKLAHSNKNWSEKVFVISEEKYAELEPYIQLNTESQTTQNSVLQNINLATAADLEALPGIGEKWQAEF